MKAKEFTEMHTIIFKLICSFFSSEGLAQFGKKCIESKQDSVDSTYAENFTPTAITDTFGGYTENITPNFSA